MLGRLLGSDILLKTSLMPDIPQVMVDRSQIDQVLLNLAANARDAMPEGGLFSLTTMQTRWSSADAVRQVESTPGECVLLEVRDSGQGMDKETASRIFEPFFTTKTEGRGTGLGLSTVYGIIRQSGGWIHVETAPDQGTTFQIYLPAAKSVAPRPGSGEASGEARAPTASGTILIVEDQEDIRLLLTRILRSVVTRSSQPPNRRAHCWQATVSPERLTCCSPTS